MDRGTKHRLRFVVLKNRPSGLHAEAVYTPAKQDSTHDDFGEIEKLGNFEPFRIE